MSRRRSQRDTVSPSLPDQGLLRRAERQLASETLALELLTNDRPLSEVLEALCHGVEELFPDALCSILLLDSDGRHLRHGAAPSLPSAYNRAIDGVEIGPRVGSCGSAAYLKRQVIARDVASDPLWVDYRALALRHGLHACWSTPVLSADGAVSGTFAIYYREPRAPSQADLDMIDRAKSLASLAIARKRAETDLFTEKEKAQVTLKSIGDGVITTDLMGQVEYLNPMAEQLLGWTNEEAQGRPLSEVMRATSSTGGTMARGLVEQVVASGKAICPDAFLSHREGRLRFAIEQSASPIRDRRGEMVGVVLVFRDVTQSNEMAAELMFRASHDPLTGLPNRALMLDRLRQAITRAARDRTRLALLFIDLDRFKDVNDAHGHSHGDQLLRMIGERLTPVSVHRTR